MKKPSLLSHKIWVWKKQLFRNQDSRLFELRRKIQILEEQGELKALTEGEQSNLNDLISQGGQ